MGLWSAEHQQSREDCLALIAALDAALAEGKRVDADRNSWRNAALGNDDLPVQRELTASTAREKRMREALKTILKFPPKREKRRTKDGYPQELIYDEYAYRRIVDSYREAARQALKDTSNE